MKGPIPLEFPTAVLPRLLATVSRKIERPVASYLAAFVKTGEDMAGDIHEPLPLRFRDGQPLLSEHMNELGRVRRMNSYLREEGGVPFPPLFRLPLNLPLAPFG